MNDMLQLLSQCNDPDLAAHYKKFVPYYDMPNDIAQYNGNVRNHILLNFRILIFGESTRIEDQYIVPQLQKKYRQETDRSLAR